MPDVKSITFVEDHLGDYESLINTLDEWYRFNRGNVNIVNVIFDVKEENFEHKDDYRRSITVFYEGTSAPNPQECNHPSSTIKTIKEPTCTSHGIDQKICATCGKVLGTIETPMLSHSWVSNGDGTHKCAYGCGTIQTCSPNGYDDICESCGYQSPPDPIQLVILTDFVNGMIINKPGEQVFVTNAPEDEVTWSITGDLPNGVTFDNGVLSGTPTESGTYQFTASASYHKQTVDKEYVMYVDKPYIVTFDPDDGSVDETVREVFKGALIGELPIPTHESKIFGGWFTAKVGGLKVDENYSVAADVTLYARWGDDSGINFGDAVTTFNMHVNGDRTNYNDGNYTLYARIANGEAGTSNLTFQTGIASDDGSNNMTDTNKLITLYLKVNNLGDAGAFDIGFDCDSYVVGYDNDRVRIKRIENGIDMANGLYTITCPYELNVWAGQYSERTSHRFDEVGQGFVTGDIDSGFAFTMRNIFINSNSYAILEVKFEKQ